MLVLSIGPMASPKAEMGIKFAGSAAAISALRQSLVIRALAVGKVVHKQIETSYTADPAREDVSEMQMETVRQTIPLRRGKAKIDAVFDFCVVETPNRESAPRRAAFSEAELCLVKGSTTVLFAIARLCLEESRGAFQLSVTPKLDRARQAFGVSMAQSAANRIDIDPLGNAGDALAAALDFCACRVMALMPSIVETRNPQGLRQMRIILRRFRSIERLFRKSVREPSLRTLSKQARVFARVLGRTRDWDVFVDETLAAVEKSGPVPQGFDQLRACARSLRRSAWEEAVGLVSSAEFSSFTLALLEAAHLQKWRRKGHKSLKKPVTLYASRSLDKRLAKARNFARDLDTKTIGAGHPLRVELKKLRYGAQLFRNLYPKEKRKPYLKSLSTLQDAFGAINDAAVAQELAYSAAKGEGKDVMRAAGFVSGYRGAQAQEATRNILESWETFSSMPPFWRDKKQ